MLLPVDPRCLLDSIVQLLCLAGRKDCEPAMHFALVSSVLRRLRFRALSPCYRGRPLLLQSQYLGGSLAELHMEIRGLFHIAEIVCHDAQLRTWWHHRYQD